MPVIQSDVESHDECCIGWGHTVCPQESTSIGDLWDSKEIGILIYGISPGKGEALPGFLPLSGAISSVAARLVVDGCREHAEESSNHIQELFFPACSYIESEMLGCKIMNDSKDEMTTVPVRWVPPAKTTPGMPPHQKTLERRGSVELRWRQDPTMEIHGIHSKKPFLRNISTIFYACNGVFC